MQIIGQNPPGTISNSQLAIPAGRGAVEVTGYVSDIRPYLRRATVAVAPMAYGAGIQNKVLEAMACGTPVLATRQAVAALGAVDGTEVLVAEGAEEFARRILEMLADAELRERTGRAGRRYVEREHDWNCMAERLESIYREAIDRRVV